MPFDNMGGADQYLVLFRGGIQGIFDETRAREENSEVPVLQDLLQKTTTAFWDTY